MRATSSAFESRSSCAVADICRQQLRQRAIKEKLEIVKQSRPGPTALPSPLNGKQAKTAQWSASTFRSTKSVVPQKTTDSSDTGMPASLLLVSIAPLRFSIRTAERCEEIRQLLFYSHCLCPNCRTSSYISNR